MIQRASGDGTKKSQPEMVGVGLSIATHVALVVLLSLIVFSNDRAARFETEVSISDSLPAGVTATLEDDAALMPESESIAMDDVGAASDFVPTTDASLMPQGLADNAAGLEIGEASGTKVLTGLEAAVADIQERVERAGGKTGEIQFSLSWHDRNDLDLHVITPKGDRVHFHRRKSSCGGELELQWITGADGQVLWHRERPPRGPPQLQPASAQRTA